LGLLVRFVQGVPASQAVADLQAIIDAGQGDRPLKDLKFRWVASVKLV